MNRIEKKEIKGTNEFLYYKKLENGMEVYLIPNNKINNIYATFTTKYGSSINEFVPIDENKMIKVPKGVAHFLEHKVFEQDKRMQPFEFYSKSGTDSNAHTSLKNTTYEFIGPNNFEKNLEYLIDFVQDPNITNENVEKEKGIIEQELRMYMDDPFWCMFDGIRNNMLENNPSKYPIGGTIDSIYKINKKVLEKCYNTFYHPSNMFIVITGNFSQDEAINIIEVNQQKKTYNKAKEIKIKKYIEKNEVIKKEEEITKNIDMPKMCYGIKINISNVEIKDKCRLDIYISLLFNILFGVSSEFFENMSNRKYLSIPPGISEIETDSHILITLTCESNYPDKLTNEIKYLLDNIKISDKELEIYKKSYISNYITKFDNIVATNDLVIDNVIEYGGFKNNIIDIIKSLNIDEFNKIINSIDMSNSSTYIVNKETKQ